MRNHGSPGHAPGVKPSAPQREQEIAFDNPTPDRRRRKASRVFMACQSRWDLQGSEDERKEKMSTMMHRL